jgi:hypothetical protein
MSWAQRVGGSNPLAPPSFSMTYGNFCLFVMINYVALVAERAES